MAQRLTAVLTVAVLCSAVLLSNCTPSRNEDSFTAVKDKIEEKEQESGGVFSKLSATLTNLFSVNLNIEKWGYNLGNGPNVWASMFPRGSMVVGGCNGNFQSPIPLRSNGPETVVDNENTVAMNYPTVGGWVMHRTRGRLFLQREPAMGMGSMTYKGKTYTVRRVDLHKPAQHEVNGLLYDLEMDIHHSSDDGQMASVAVFVKADAPKEFMHNVDINSHFDFHSLPKSEGDTVHLADTFSLSFLMDPKNLTYFSYEGSQDHPPCVEGVQWIVMASPNWMNNGDLSFYPPEVSGNARTLQALHGRTVYMGDGSKVKGNGLSYNTDKGDPGSAF